ncbi:hypothetical protein Deipr_1053 [Deinococcus proteolyticus MRP]|uniref:Uncharacterized protein n=1 Tax=Deinococcus proteolyticus (strain ATCC 35074 / DSM 20540 / JCM 6276 / NBRC 101906 / NCIMB 13154 / VKM Ac-1939 / CCM 2703 / MRP) TaxID=693977 RepID=F0RN63_DEIPM|nr:hypothetical protein Deipr_1053 [Deinococcus proteolyticus MRP]
MHEFRADKLDKTNAVTLVGEHQDASNAAQPNFQPTLELP